VYVLMSQLPYIVRTACLGRVSNPFVSVLSPGESILKKNRVRSPRCKCETKYLRLLYYDLMLEAALSDFDP